MADKNKSKRLNGRLERFNRALYEPQQFFAVNETQMRHPVMIWTENSQVTQRVRSAFRNWNYMVHINRNVPSTYHAFKGKPSDKFKLKRFSIL